jgi:membrane protein
MASPSVTSSDRWYERLGAQAPRFREALERIGPWVDHARDVLAFAGRRARAVQLSQVAGSLTFTTVLSLVPLLAVALAVFSAFPLFADYRSALEKTLVTSLLPEQISNVILRYLQEFSAQATRVTAFGLVFLVAAALLMILTVDRVLNDIWQVRQRRALAQRVLIYWALLTIGPLMFGGSLALTSYLASLSMYVFVPNRSVQWRDALSGGFIASALSEGAKTVFALYIARGTYQSIYGAFAALPVFLLWVYISWWVTLFGAAIAATLPMLRQTRFADESRAGNRFVTAVALLAALYHALRAGKNGGRMSTKALAMHVRTYPEHVERLLLDLEALDYVSQLNGRHSGEWLLTASPAQANLVPLFKRLAVDPSNEGLANWMTVGLAADWIERPLAELFAART